MKRLLLTFVLIIAVTTSLLALDDFYMAPAAGTYVNLAIQNWDYLDNIDKTESGLSTESVFGDRLVFYGGLEGIGVFEILGGLVSYSEFKDYAISIEITSSTWDGQYFWFTKQSDPEFKRPFQIQTSFKVYKDAFTGFYYTQETSFTDLGFLEAEHEEVLSNSPSGLMEFISSIGTYDLGYEFGLVLPGEIKNGVLTLEDNTTYPIASGTDYSAELIVTAKLTDPEGNEVDDSKFPPISFVVSIGGYYDPRYADGTENPDVDTSASLYVTPYARAANIDLLNDQGKTDIPIANVDFSIYDQSENFTSGQYDKSVFIFLSANSNPFAQDEKGFRFVHESVGFGDAELPTNSLGYTITASGTSDTTANGGSGSVIFDGTDYLTPDGSKPDDRILTAHHEMAIGDLFGGGKAHWHSWNGELLLSLDTNNRIMNEGLYRSTVYVHVVTDDSLGGVV